MYVFLYLYVKCTAYHTKSLIKGFHQFYNCVILIKNFSLKLTDGGGWRYLYSFICLSAGAVEWEPSCFATTLLRHAPPRVTLVLVLFVIFGGLF